MNSYLDILPLDKTAIAVKTNGENFVFNDNEVSSTGCWVVSKDRMYDLVIVFLQNESNGFSNKVYMGEFFKKEEEGDYVRKGKIYPRYRIFVKKMRLIGETDQDWTSFVCVKSRGFERIYLENKVPKNIIYLDADSIEAQEGYREEFNVMASKRDRKLANARKEKDDYTCQSCSKQYIVNDKYIIDCHHLNPVSLGSRKTKLEDLVSLCPTCHRIAHTRVPPYSLDELREIMKRYI